MSNTKVLSRVIVKHSGKCFMKKKPNPWSGLTDGHFWGNFEAKEDTKGGNHIWHKVICNDPDCPAIKAVHFSVLVNA